MSNTYKYGVKLVKRPYIKAKDLDYLSSTVGKKIIEIETEKVLINHSKTLSKLVGM